MSEHRKSPGRRVPAEPAPPKVNPTELNAKSYSWVGKKGINHTILDWGSLNQWPHT